MDNLIEMIIYTIGGFCALVYFYFLYMILWVLIG